MIVDVADVLPSVTSWIVVTIMAVTGIAFLKWALAMFPIPGLTELVGAV